MPQRYENLNKPADIGQLLQRMSLQDQALMRLTPEENQANVNAAGPALLKRIKEGVAGMIKGNSTDIINTIQQASDLIPIGGRSNGGKPLGDEIFQNITGITPTGSNAEVAGSMVSVGGLIKKAAVAGGAALGTMAILTRGVKAEDTVAKGLSAAERGMIVSADKAGRPQLYEKAVEMVRANPKIDNKELFDKTGTYFDSDGRLKAFISDKDAKLKKLPEEVGTGIENILEHPRLFEAQPELQALRIKGDARIPSNNGSFQVQPSGDKVITTSTETAEDMKVLTEAEKAKSKTDVKSVILHETQHAIQAIEGFTRGSNPIAHKEFDPVSIQEKLIRARQSGDQAQIEATHRFAKKANELVKADRQRAHVLYENVPGEQEARFTQFTENMSDVEGNTFLKRVIDAGQTPQTWDTQTIPPRAGK